MRTQQALSFQSVLAILLAGCIPAVAAAGDPCGSHPTATVDEVLDCSANRTQIATFSLADPSELGGPCGLSECFSCGSPFLDLEQTEAEHIYEFTCGQSGPVTFELTSMDCDLDLYVLDISCDPFFGCGAGSTSASTTADSVTFGCNQGETVYVVVEAHGFSIGGAGACVDGDGYTLELEAAGGSACPEDCVNGLDDDFDGDTDCDDSDCSDDLACACDVDGDGFDAVLCGGTDCNDLAPDSHETPGEVIDLLFTGSESLSWSPPLVPGGSGVRYDTIRSDLPGFGVPTCVESDDGSDTMATDVDVPSLGGVFLYLIRAENDCPDGQGTLGTGTGGLPRVATDCP